MKINLGCWRSIMNWYVNVDCIPGPWVDQVFDLDVYPRPFATDQIDEYYCDNILEHLDYDKTIREIYRTLKRWWFVVIKVPYFSNPWAFFADHKCFFNYDSYNKFCNNIWSTTDMQEPLFEMVYRKITFLYEYKKWLIKYLLCIFYALPKLFYTISPRLYIWLLSYLFPASEIHWKLKKK